MTIVQLNDWKKFIADHPDAHLLQTGEWGELKSAFGWAPIRVIDAGSGVQLLFKKLPLGYSVAYIPRGPVGIWSNSLLNEVISICHSRKAIFLKIEPDEEETDKSNNAKILDAFRGGVRSIQPRRTIILDLSLSEADILSRMKQKCRYNIRLAEKKEINIIATENIEAYYNLMLETGKRDGFGIHSKGYYQKAFEIFRKDDQCALFLATYMDKNLAGLMVFRQGKRAWYLFGASNDEERNRMPTYLLQWEAIRWAKRMGCLEYDLWGVPDQSEETLENEFESRSDGLWGVYRFKRGFGGRLVRSAEAKDMVLKPFLYQLYHLYSNFRGHGE